MIYLTKRLESKDLPDMLIITDASCLAWVMKLKMLDNLLFHILTEATLDWQSEHRCQALGYFILQAAQIKLVISNRTLKLWTITTWFLKKKNEEECDTVMMHTTNSKEINKSTGILDDKAFPSSTFGLFLKRKCKFKEQFVAPSEAFEKPEQRRKGLIWFWRSSERMKSFLVSSWWSQMCLKWLRSRAWWW